MTSCTGQGGTGTLYSYAQLMGLWINNGGPAPVAPVAAAVAMAESGGCSTALNPVDNGGKQSSYGLWQISNGTHTPPASNWSDGNVNAQLAVAKYKGAGNSFSPWGTYDSGAYTPYLSPGTTPDTNVPGAGTTPANANANAALAAAASSPDCLLGFGGVPGTSWWNDLFGSGGNVGSFCIISKSNARAVMGAGLIVAGAIPAMLGALILAAFAFRASGVQSAVTQTAGRLGPAGRAVQAATPRAREERQVGRREQRVGQVERRTQLARRERRAGITP